MKLEFSACVGQVPGSLLSTDGISSKLKLFNDNVTIGNHETSDIGFTLLVFMRELKNVMAQPSKLPLKRIHASVQQARARYASFSQATWHNSVWSSTFTITLTRPGIPTSD